MTDVFSHKLGYSETKWNYIQVPIEFLNFFPSNKTFKILYGNLSYEVTVNKAHRIISKKLLKQLEVKEGIVVSFRKKSANDFLIEIS